MSSCRTSLAVSALRIMRYCPNKNNRNIAVYSSVPVFFMPKFIAHGGVSLYIITRVLTRVMNGAILSKLELQKKPRKPHENG